MSRVSKRLGSSSSPTVSKYKRSRVTVNSWPLKDSQELECASAPNTQPNHVVNRRDSTPMTEREGIHDSIHLQVVKGKVPARLIVESDTATSSTGAQDHDGDFSDVADVEEQGTSPSDTKRRSRWPRLKESRLGYTWKQLLINLLILALLVVVAVFVQATYDAERNSVEKVALDRLMKADVSTTLAVLRVSQGILSTLTSLSLVDSLVALQWSMIESRQGLGYLDLLALSPTSGIAGALELICSSITKRSSKAYAFLRLSLISLVWVSGIVLFLDTSLTTVYDTASMYNATAGVGPFNQSLIQPFMDALHSTAPDYPYEVLPYTYYAAVYTLVLNPLVTSISKPVACETRSCISYLLSGGLEYVAPWVPQGNDDHDLIKIGKVPSVQLDFETGPSSEFLETECETFGEFGFTIGIRLCIAESQTSHRLLRAGLFVCLNGTDGDSCGGNEERPNITATFSAYTRSATIVAARSNYSIIDVADISAPTLLQDFDTGSYRIALNWLLDYSAAAIPAPSSVAQSFWSSTEQLKDPSTYGILQQNFQSILAFPFWFFNNNNWGNVELRSNQIISSLPSQFYTEASIVAPFTKIRFNPSMFALFLTFQALAMIFCWGCLCWLWFGPKIATEISLWSLFDVAYKTTVQSGENNVSFQGLTTSDVIGVMKFAQVYAKTD
ncbi:hypothetical protein O1611_g5298 [Lasiodiplodia mahajangana]|uniref:Uncharacterized protein n=1 Tax=Lasiodiplodia mahajangana TaxID=1108764 RepID=A0ACC2JLP4_9PEZI|nr:hypothetical protein O1611_g5298 [Lasiodiplodia mahajangana]